MVHGNCIINDGNRPQYNLDYDETLLLHDIMVVLCLQSIFWLKLQHTVKLCFKHCWCCWSCFGTWNMILKMKFDSLYIVALRKTEQHNKKPMKGRLVVTSSKSTKTAKFMFHKFILLLCYSQQVQQLSCDFPFIFPLFFPCYPVKRKPSLLSR